MKIENGRMYTESGLVIPEVYEIYGAQAEAVFLARVGEIPAEVLARVDAVIRGDKPAAGEPKQEPAGDYW